MRTQLIALAALLLAAGSHTVLAAPSATDQVKTTIDAVLVVLKRDGLSSKAKHEEMKTLISQRFNFRNMSRRTLARNWSSTDAEQQDRFVELFTQILANTYIVVIEEFTGEVIEYTGEKIEGENYALVDTVIVGNNMKTPVSYKLQREGDEWRAYDVVVEGVSLIANYRGSYGRMVRRKGVDTLIAKMEEKIKQSTI